MSWSALCDQHHSICYANLPPIRGALTPQVGFACDRADALSMRSPV
jgi:hypothetical protein